MAHGLTCDGCGEALLADTDVRYVLEIRGYAAYDPLEITRDDLEGDLEGSIRELLRAMGGQDPQALEDQVHKEFQLDLCPRCWRSFVRDPLAGLRRAEES